MFKEYLQSLFKHQFGIWPKCSKKSAFAFWFGGTLTHDIPIVSIQSFNHYHTITIPYDEISETYSAVTFPLPSTLPTAGSSSTVANLRRKLESSKARDTISTALKSQRVTGWEKEIDVACLFKRGVICTPSKRWSRSEVRRHTHTSGPRPEICRSGTVYVIPKHSHLLKLAVD